MRLLRAREHKSPSWRNAKHMYRVRGMLSESNLRVHVHMYAVRVGPTYVARVPLARLASLRVHNAHSGAAKRGSVLRRRMTGRGGGEGSAALDRTESDRSAPLSAR